MFSHDPANFPPGPGPIEAFRGMLPAGRGMSGFRLLPS